MSWLRRRCRGDLLHVRVLVLGDDKEGVHSLHRPSSKAKGKDHAN